MSMKYWITLTEVRKILKKYSVRDNEFERVENSRYSYLNRELGYMISLSEDKLSLNKDKKAERIIVSHTNGNGKIVYMDIWERDSEGRLQFSFRNPANMPVSDREYIKSLEKQIEELRQAGIEYKNKYQKLINENRKTEKGNIGSEQQAVKNVRGAGRKKADKAWQENYKIFVELHESKKSMKEIIDIMEIGQATYFRYKKYYKEHSS